MVSVWLPTRLGKSGGVDISQLIRKLRRIVIARGVHKDDADDVVQEAFVRLEGYVRTHEVRSKEAFLVSAAVNIAIDDARRRRRSPFTRGTFDVELVSDLGPQPDELLNLRERLTHLGEGLERLDPQVKRIVFAHRLEGATFPQIAARENLSVANVEKKVARAMLFLMKWLNEQ
jgi:RNA polymerase sigma factor (sigma-70 family)